MGPYRARPNDVLQPEPPPPPPPPWWQRALCWVGWHPRDRVFCRYHYEVCLSCGRSAVE